MTRPAITIVSSKAVEFLRLRRLLYMVLFLILTTGATPKVHAQTTRFLGLGFPGTVPYGSSQPTPVKLIVSHQDAKSGYLLVASLFDDEKQDFLRGTATGWPDPCLLAPELTVNTSCVVVLHTTSGQENVTFGFSTTDNPHDLGVWHLRAGSGLEYPDQRVIQGSLFSQGFPVQVVNATTQTTLPPSTTATITITQSTQSNPPSSNALPMLVALAMIVVLIVIALAYNARKPRRRSKHRS